MKYFAVVAIFACIALAQGLDDEIKEKLAKIKTECIDETHVDAEVVKKAKHDGEFADDEKLNEFFFCFFKKIGFMNEAGEYDIEKMKEKITLFHDKDVAEKLVDECAKDTEEGPTAKAIHLAKCYHENKPAGDHHH